MEYSDAHRVFLQVMLQHRILTAIQVKSIFKKVCSHFEIPGDLANLQEFVNKINVKLCELHMSIRKSLQEGDEKDVNCYVIINNLNNDSTRSCSSFTKPELAYLKKLVEILITSEGGFIRETSALNISPNQSAKLSVGAAEHLIGKLVEEKWLLRENGRISLSALTICELQMYIDHNFQEHALKCYFCKEFVFKGHECAECQTRGHRSCLKKYWAETEPRGTICPNKSCNAIIDVLTETNKRRRSSGTECSED